MKDPRRPGADTVFIPLSVAKAQPPAEPQPAPAVPPVAAPAPPPSATDPFAGFRHDLRTTEFRARHRGPSLALLVGLFAALVLALALLLATSVLIGLVAW